MGNLKLKNKRVLVTGGNGYLGANLVKALNDAGASVFIIDKKKSRDGHQFNIDITDQSKVDKAIKKIRPQLIFHLAAALDRERDFRLHGKLMQVNYYGTVNLLLALENIEYENFVFTSTGEVYGDNPSPFNEKMLPSPASPYSMSKLFAEIAIRTFSNLNDKNFTILRLFNLIGKEMPENFFLPQLLKALRIEKEFEMTGGEQTRDFLFVDDVVSAMILAGIHEKAKGEVFNLCSGQHITLKELANKLKRELNSDCEIKVGAKPYRKNEIWNMTGNNSKIKSKLGIKLWFDFDDIDKVA